MKVKGYTKSTIGKFDLMSMLKSDIYKDKNEPFDVWFARKIADQFPESISGGMDEQGMNRKADAQNPKPLL